MKKKIIIYGDSPQGGYISYADTISEICKLIKDEYEIYILAFTGDNYSCELYTVLPSIMAFSNNKMALSPADNLIYYSQLIKPDLILVHTDTNLFSRNRKQLHDFLEKSKIPFFLYAVIDGLPIPRKDRDFYEMVNEHGRVITFSEFAHNEIDSVYIPHGVDFNYFKPLDNRDELRTICGIKKDDIVIGFVGSGTQRKQPFRFLNLVKRLQNEYGDKIKCVFNMSSEAQAINEYIFDNEIDLVDFRSKTSHMAECYALMDIFVLPTAGEGFCKPFVECAACGVPIVTTDCCTGPQLVSGHGELVKVGAIDYCFCCGTSRYLCDEEDLYLKTKKLIDNAQLRKEYSDKGKQLVKPYEWNLWKNKWLEVLNGRVSSS